MSVTVVRLCRDVLREDFGPVVERVGTILVKKGRLPLNQIKVLAKVSLRQVRESLLILIQHHLVYHADTGETGATFTYYEANVDEILARLRIGLIINSANEWFGKEGGVIIRLLLSRGMLRLKDLRVELELDKGKINKSVLFTKIFTQMARGRYIRAITPLDKISPTDRHISEQAKEIEQFKSPPTAQELAALKRVREEKEVAEINSSVIPGMKRKLTDADTGPNKKMNLDAEAVEEVDQDVYWKINYEQFNLKLRNKSIIRFVDDRINKGAAAVMKAAFTVVEDRMRQCKEEKSVVMSATLITHNLPSEINLQNDIIMDIEGSNFKPTQQQLTNELLDLLCNDHVKFMTKEDERGSGQYRINLEKIAEALKIRLVESVVSEKFGSVSARLMRILMSKQKLDEKQVAKIAMVPGKDAREKLHQLATAGLLEVQEVPKSADRAPSRTFYLWHVPMKRCQEVILEDCYKALASIRQRRNEEIKMRSRLLEKTQREDVKANQDLLNASDKAQLELLNKVLDWLEVAELRLDEMAMILRDY
ncbi:RNA polymerase III subunit C82 [Basidiobolus ranarum]|uniref:DNA-directed RNA polymerase III subunit RPC3 n=1 Tax=Basidiobolus ranarum TaxID=34480 RepID=A0ABR2WU02_9FUNG